MWAYEHYSSTTESISKMQKVKKETNWKLEAVKPYWGKSLPELKIADIIKESGFYKSLIGWSKSPVIPKIIAWKKALSDLSAWRGAANADNGRGSPTSPPSAGAPAVMGWICLRMNAASLFSPLTYVNISCGCLLSTTWKRCLCSLFLQLFISMSVFINIQSVVLLAMHEECWIGPQTLTVDKATGIGTMPGSPNILPKLLESEPCQGPQTSSRAGLPLPSLSVAPPASWHHSAIKNIFFLSSNSSTTLLPT